MGTAGGRKRTPGASVGRRCRCVFLRFRRMLARGLSICCGRRRREDRYVIKTLRQLFNRFRQRMETHRLRLATYKQLDDFDGCLGVLRSGQPDVKTRRCYDCIHHRAHVTWWCFNPDAVRERGSRIPGAIGCSFWDPTFSLDDFPKSIHRTVTRHPNVVMLRNPLS